MFDQQFLLDECAFDQTFWQCWCDAWYMICSQTPNTANLLCHEIMLDELYNIVSAGD